MISSNAYGEKLVNFMLKREQVFIQFRSCYYLLYQCLVPNTREALSLLVQHYSVPKDFERSILSGESPRVCIQGILNYLLIKVRGDKNFVKFWDALRSMINHPELRMAVERIQKRMRTTSKGSIQVLCPPHRGDIIIISNKDGEDIEGTFPLHEGALSVTDDYCVSFTVTMVDVRSCTRPTRSHEQLPTKATTSVSDELDMSSLSVAQQMLINNTSLAELQSHYSVLVRSMPDDYMNTVSQLERHLTGDHIGSILECKDVFTANQRILDCLIVQLDNKEDIFDLCDKLSIITDAPLLTAAIEDLKIDVIISLKSGDTPDSSSNSTNGGNMDSSLNLTPNNLTPNNLSNSTAIVSPAPERKLVPDIFYRLRPGQYSPRALAVLKKHYYALWRSLPDDHMITLTTLCEIFKISDDIIDMITSKPTSEEANQVMLNYVIFVTNGDQQMNAFCDLMTKLIINPKLSRVTSNFKKDCMDIVIQNMLQSMLQRNPLTSTGSGNHAHIEELPSDAVSTFSEDVGVVTTESSTAGDGHPQQDGGDIGASVIEHLPAGVSAQCRAMLHSYYDTLWQSFPQDHLITLSRLCNLLPVEERLVETIALYPTLHHDVANRRILNAALSNVKHDSVLLGFCVLVEKLIANPDKAKTIENLKSDCLKVMQKKQDSVKPSDEQVSDVPANANIDTVPAKTGEVGNSGVNDDVSNEPSSVANSTVRIMDSDPLAFHVLPSTVSADAIAVLRKYYHMLLANMPDDHVTTVSILSENVPLDEMFFNEIISFTDHNFANEKILNGIVMAINRDIDFKGFCQLIKNLVKRECRFSKEMLQLEIECFNIEEKAVKHGSLINNNNTSSVGSTNTTPGSNNIGAAVGSVTTRYDEPKLLQHLSLGVSPECRIVLKKYYNFLWKSFPEDHLIAFGKFNRTLNLDDDLNNSIISAPTSERGNQIMLDIATIGISKDRTLMEFCYLVEEIIDNPKLSKIMKVFRNECVKAVEKCQARLPSLTSTANISQSISQVASTTTATKPDVAGTHTTQEVKSDGDTVEAVVVADTEIFTKLSSHQLSDKGIAVLKKHYSILLKSLPGDHMITLGRLCKAIPVDDETVDEIISYTDSPIANKKMLHLLILMIENDNNLLDFCNSVEKILQDMPMVLGPLRNDCSKVIESVEEAPLVPVTVNDTPMAVTVPQQSLVPSSNVPTTANTGGGLSINIDDVMNVFSHIPPNLLSPKGTAILKKYYFALWRAFPEDYMTSLAKISAQLPLRDDAINLITSKSTSIGANKSILDILISFRGFDNDLMEFCSMVEAVIGDEQKVVQVVEPLRQECLQLMIEKNTNPTLPHPVPSLTSNAVTTTISSGAQQTTSSHTAVTETTPVEETNTSQQNATMTAEDTKAALRTFDEHFHLMTLIEPCCIQEGLQTSGLIPNGDLLTNTPPSPGSTVMENVLKEVRSCVEHNGAEKFLMFINVLHTEGRYVVLGCHIFNKYRSYGGQESSTIKIDPLLSALSTLPIQQLLEQLRWHQKQILAGLQYQCLLPLPDYYIERDQLLEAIVNKLTEDNGVPAVGTTVTITGVGGIGKSTLAKALCHDLRLRNYFLDGFLWIRLGPIPLSPAIKLGQLYHLLTNKTEVGNQSFFTDKLQSLVVNHLHKLLVIIDDVWEVSDALVYTQVFNGCKIVMTTRRENVNKLIPSKMCITIERMNEEEAVKLLTYNLPGQGPSEHTSQLAQKLHCWPLLLKLVHGQLSVCISEHHKPLIQAIDQVEEALKGKGLDAVDVDKRRSAVMAVTECSIALLSSDEMYTLQKLVLSAGFSMPVAVPLLPAMLKINSEDIEKLCKRLLKLGLINHCQFMTASNNKAMPCYEVHLIVAQYIIDHMTFESPVQLVDALDLGDINVISTVLAGGDDSNVSYHCLATVTAIDAIVLPNHIRSLFTLIKCLQHEVKNCILQLSVLFIRGSRMDLAQSAINFKEGDAVKCVEKLHQSIREDCKTLQSLLLNDRHEQAIDWITGYVKNHPLRKALATFTAFVKDLLHKCQNDSSLVSRIKSHTDKIVLFYKTTLQKRSEHVKVTLRRGLVAMINSGNITTEQYKHLLDVYSTNLKLATGV